MTPNGATVFKVVSGSTGEQSPIYWVDVGVNVDADAEVYAGGEHCDLELAIEGGGGGRLRASWPKKTNNCHLPGGFFFNKNEGSRKNTRRFYFCQFVPFTSIFDFPVATWTLRVIFNIGETMNLFEEKKGKTCAFGKKIASVKNLARPFFRNLPRSLATIFANYHWQATHQD